MMSSILGLHCFMEHLKPFIEYLFRISRTDISFIVGFLAITARFLLFFRNRQDRKRYQRKRDFLRQNPEYGYRNSEKGFIDRWKKEEIPSDEVYLDYAGASLPWKSQLKQEIPLLANPHSSGPAASRTKRMIEQVRKRIVDHFNAEDYEIVWTSGATQALEYVATFWEWECFIYPQESHTSVVGMREKAKSFLSKPLDDLLEDLANERIQGSPKTLFALALESNFDGRRLNLKDFQLGKCKLLLDIAKAAATGPVNLGELNPDFACISFYKLFGAPTGLGCLFVRRNMIHEFSNKGEYFGGGSVDMVLPTEEFTVRRKEPSRLASISRGTVHFRGIVELLNGFQTLDSLGGMLSIEAHCMTLTNEMIKRMRTLSHGNGNPVVELYGPWNQRKECNGVSHGPTVTFNILRQDGTYVGYNEVSKLAGLNQPPIQVRTGCFCNPGACQLALQMTNSIVKSNYESTGHVCGDQIDVINEKPTGAIRVSFGRDSTWEDLDDFMIFIDRMFVSTSEVQASPRGFNRIPQHVMVTEMYIFPIKSCAAQRVKEWQFDYQSGKPIFDRDFALVDTNGVAMRLQAYPKMALIRPRIELATMELVVEAPKMPSLRLALLNTEIYEKENSVVKMCGNRCGGALWGDRAASEWFSEFLEVKCWLARFTESSYQVSSAAQMAGVPRRKGVAFANEQPILLISDQAVQRLNRVLRQQSQKQVSTKHFRPNLVVKLLGKNSDLSQHEAEDSWKELSLDGSSLNFEVAGDCARCSMVDVDPSSGMKGNTLRALAEYRRKNGQIIFGIFLKSNPKSDLTDFTALREGDTFLCK